MLDYVHFVRAEAAAALGQDDLGLTATLAASAAAPSDSALTSVLAWREADLLWETGKAGEAAAKYERLSRKDPKGGDPAVGLFRRASLLWGQGQDRGALADKDLQSLVKTLLLDFPTHPLAKQAARWGVLGDVKHNEEDDQRAAFSPEDRMRARPPFAKTRSGDWP